MGLDLNVSFSFLVRTKRTERTEVAVKPVASNSQINSFILSIYC